MTSPQASELTLRLVRWLSEGPVQRADGAVAGWLDTHGSSAYAYPEIVGYYLQWLAWRMAEGDDRLPLKRRALAAQRWLRDWLAAGGPPRTRVYAGTSPPDWRNRAVFCFDLAMVMRGLASATRWGMLEPDLDVVKAIGRELDALIAADGQFDACRVHAPDRAFPDRWSTRRGAFLAKAAAGIDCAAQIVPGVSDRLREAAARTFTASLRRLREEPHAETHPLLYAIEGYLNWPRHGDFAANLPMVVAHFDRLVSQSMALGRVPESERDPGQARLDVVAQALRVGRLLAHHCGPAFVDLTGPAGSAPGGRDERKERCESRLAFLRVLESALAAAVTADGAIPFVRGAAPPQRNAWATMFASQAFSWADRDPLALARIAMEPLLV